MLKLDGYEQELGRFPDGTLLMKPSSPNVPLTGTSPRIEWRYEHDGELFALYSLTRFLQQYYQDIELFMPYIPNARMDRVANQNDVFTLKYFAEIINSLNFKCVKVLDPHSAVSEALIERIKVLSPKNYVEEAIYEQAIYELDKAYDASDAGPLLFYPDEGAMKRYSGMINTPYTFGVKRRDWETGQILSLDVVGGREMVQGRHILIVDDICSKGGTFYYAAKALKELGAGAIYLYVTHCEDTILKGKVLSSGLIEKVFTTDSICTIEHEKLVKFGIRPDLDFD